MHPADLQAKLGEFVGRVKDSIRDSVNNAIFQGHRPEDFVFVAVAPDDDSRRVTATMFNLDLAEVPDLFAVAYQDFMAKFGRILPLCHPGGDYSRRAGNIIVWAIIEGWPCGVRMDLAAPDTVPRA